MLDVVGERGLAGLMWSSCSKLTGMGGGVIGLEAVSVDCPGRRSIHKSALNTGACERTASSYSLATERTERCDLDISILFRFEKSVNRSR